MVDSIHHYNAPTIYGLLAQLGMKAPAEPQGFIPALDSLLENPPRAELFTNFVNDLVRYDQFGFYLAMVYSRLKAVAKKKDEAYQPSPSAAHKAEAQAITARHNINNQNGDPQRAAIEALGQGLINLLHSPEAGDVDTINNYFNNLHLEGREIFEGFGVPELTRLEGLTYASRYDSRYESFLRVLNVVFKGKPAVLETIDRPLLRFALEATNRHALHTNLTITFHGLPELERIVRERMSKNLSGQACFENSRRPLPPSSKRQPTVRPT